MSAWKEIAKAIVTAAGTAAATTLVGKALDHLFKEPEPKPKPGTPRQRRTPAKAGNGSPKRRANPAKRRRGVPANPARKARRLP